VFKDMQGQQQRLQDYRGKWVLVNFWATGVRLVWKKCLIWYLCTRRTGRPI